MIRKITILGIASVLAVLQGCSSQDGVNGAPCTVKQNGDGTSQIQCPDGTVVDIIGAVNGENGNNGKSGENGTQGGKGKDGSKCSVDCADEQTVRIVCEDGTEEHFRVAFCSVPEPVAPSPAMLGRGEIDGYCRILPDDGRAACWGTTASGFGAAPVSNGDLGSVARFLDTSDMPKGLATSWKLIMEPCGITTDGTAYCWGSDQTRGDGPSADFVASNPVTPDFGIAPRPVYTSHLPKGLATRWNLITVGNAVCGITSDGAGYCWGNYRNGRLGVGTISVNASIPTPIDMSSLPAGTSWSVLSSGREHACGITTGGTAYCWGSDPDGRLGNGPALIADQFSPTPVDISALPAGTTWSTISAGYHHTCGITKAGDAYCWGEDLFGELGTSTMASKDAPSLVDSTALQAGTKWAQISAGNSYSCGVATDGKAFCWGMGDQGRLGDGMATSRTTPVAVDVSATPASTPWLVVHASLGGGTTCGLTTDGIAACWGLAVSGRLGVGSSIINDQPRPRYAVQDGIDAITRQPSIAYALGDPTNPGFPMKLISTSSPVEDLVVTVASSDPTVLPASNITVWGTGRERTASFEPVAVGGSTLTFTVKDSYGEQFVFNVEYAASGAAADPSGRYHQAISDASSAIDVGDGYMLLANDETNVLFLYKQDESGPPVKTWSFPADQVQGTEADLEAAARVGNQIVWVSSQGNARDGSFKEFRRTIFATTITGSGADVELSFAGRYGGGPGTKKDVADLGLRKDLIDWDHANGHGLGVDYLGFTAATQKGVLPNAPGGFNVEGFEFASNDTTGYLGFRAPTINVGGTQHALIVPVTNILDLVNGVGVQTGRAQFGAPIFLNLAGRSIREIRRNASGQYLISAAPPDNPTVGVNDTWALYTWDGTNAPVLNRLLPDPNYETGGAWESIVSVPNPIATGANVRLVTDSGDTSYYPLAAPNAFYEGLRKSYSQDFTLQ